MNNALIENWNESIATEDTPPLAVRNLVLRSRSSVPRAATPTKMPHRMPFRAPGF